MKVCRTLLIVASAAVSASLAGCVSYPNGKALVTPIGAAGFYTFAPEKKTPDTMSAQRTAERLARIEREAE